MATPMPNMPMPDMPMPAPGGGASMAEMMQQMQAMMEMMMGMMPGMRDMQLMSPFFTSRAGQFFWLFKGARVESTGEFVGAIIGSFVFAVMVTIAVEAAKRVERRMVVKGSGVAVVPALIGGLAHGFRLALHYLAMLLIMTFNVWVFLAVVGGHAVGYTLHRLGSTMLGGEGEADEASGLGSAGRAKAVGSSSDSDPPVAQDDCC